MFFMALILEVWFMGWVDGISITRELVRISGLILGILNQNLPFDKILGMFKYEKHWFLWYSTPSKLMVKLIEWKLFSSLKSSFQG